MILDNYRKIMSDVVKKHRWLCTGAEINTTNKFAERLRTLGGEAFAVGVSDSETSGQVGSTSFVLENENKSKENIMKDIREIRKILANPSTDVLSAINAFDPEKQACVVSSMYEEGQTLFDRRVFGAKSERWLSLEDKTTIDSFWDYCEIPRAESKVVDCNLDIAWEIAQSLDSGTGTVWVSDNTEGWHGAAERLRIVRNFDDAKKARQELFSKAKSIRIMPYLNGIPCAISGMVFENYVASFLPCETIIFERPEDRMFVYGQLGTFWTPSSRAKILLTELVKKVGDNLRKEFNYRGAFSVDGILMGEEFFPTELNPRYGGGLTLITRNLPSVWVYFLNLCVIEGVNFPKPEQFNNIVNNYTEENRFSGCRFFSLEEFSHKIKEYYVLKEGRWLEVQSSEDTNAYLEITPISTGSDIRIKMKPSDHLFGKPSAPILISLFRAISQKHSIKEFNSLSSPIVSE